LTPLPAGPSKSSRKTWFQPDGGGGAEALADGVAAVAAAAASPRVLTTATSARRTRRGLRGVRGVPEVSLMWGALSGNEVDVGGEGPWETGPEPRPGREWGTASAPESALRLPSMCSAPPRASRGVTEKVLASGASSGPERREWGQARRRGPCTRPGRGIGRRRARACFRAGAPSTAVSPARGPGGGRRSG